MPDTGGFREIKGQANAKEARTVEDSKKLSAKVTGAGAKERKPKAKSRVSRKSK